MHNKILHALTNRPGPFVTPLFSSDFSFKPAKLDPDELEFRKKMFLDIVDTDYYIRSYLSLLHSFTDIERIFEDGQATYRIEDLPPRGVRVEGGEFMSAPNAVGYFTDPLPLSLPINLTYEVRYFDAGQLDVIAVETGLARRVSYQATGTDPNKMLRFDWQDLPFKGPIQLNQQWVSGAKMTAVVEPSRFPFNIMWERIRGDLWLNKTVTNEGLMDAMSGTMDVQEKVALALLVLITSNDSVFGVQPTSNIPLFEEATTPAWPGGAPIIVTTSMPLTVAPAGEFYSLQFQATGGSGRYRWSITQGAPPVGMVFTSDGILSGIPTVQGQTNFLVQAVDY